MVLELVPQRRSLIGESSGSRSTFGDFRNLEEPCILRAQCSSGVIRYYELCLTMKSSVGFFHPDYNLQALWGRTRSLSSGDLTSVQRAEVLNPGPGGTLNDWY